MSVTTTRTLEHLASLGIVARRPGHRRAALPIGAQPGLRPGQRWTSSPGCGWGRGRSACIRPSSRWPGGFGGAAAAVFAAADLAGTGRGLHRGGRGVVSRGRKAAVPAAGGRPEDSRPGAGRPDDANPAHRCLELARAWGSVLKDRRQGQGVRSGREAPLLAGAGPARVQQQHAEDCAGAADRVSAVPPHRRQGLPRVQRADAALPKTQQPDPDAPARDARGTDRAAQSSPPLALPTGW